MRILIADDAAVIRAALTAMAASAGHEIVGEAGDAEETIALARAGKPDAVVVDGRLPPGGVAHLIARLHDLLPQARLIVIAALDETGIVRAAHAAGATGALLRPILPAQVVRAFEAWP
jgi:two-component system chemotaxis response regulator CheY